MGTTRICVSPTKLQKKEPGIIVMPEGKEMFRCTEVFIRGPSTVIQSAEGLHSEGHPVRPNVWIETDAEVACKGRVLKT